MKTIELWPRPVFGPMILKTFGKPGIVVPRYACGLVPAASASVTPPRPRTSCAVGGSVTWKPVPRMIVSTSRELPSASTMRLPVDVRDRRR